MEKAIVTNIIFPKIKLIHPVRVQDDHRHTGSERGEYLSRIENDKKSTEREC